MKLTTARRLLPTLLAASVACAALQHYFQEPDVRLERVVVRRVGLTGGNLDLVVEVYNPNRFALRGTELRVGFDVEGSHVGDVTYRDDFTVQQGDTTQVTLPLQFEWAGVSGALRSALERGEVPYTMNGEALVETPIGARTVGFSRSGRVPLTRTTSGAGAPGGR